MDIINPFGKVKVVVTGTFCGKKIVMEAGDWAFQADAAVRITVDDTVVFGVGQVSSRDSDLDYFPLMIDYEEKFYASGKISGSRFVKREGRPSDIAVQTSRLIDRPIRPLFPKGYHKEVQGIAMVLSYDPNAQPDIISMIAISAALNATSAPFQGPIGGVRVGLIDGELVCNPTTEQMEESDLDLVVAGTKEAIMMVEAGANEVDEDTMVRALELAHKEMQVVIDMQNELAEKLKTVKSEVPAVEPSQAETEVNEFVAGKMGAAWRALNGEERKAAEKELRDSMVEALIGDDEEKDTKAYMDAFSKAVMQDIRNGVLNEGVRLDGRKPDEIRPLSSQVSVLPRTHGSSIFTRGATQALNVVTLAPLSYAQILDSMDMNDYEKHYMHHYNMGGFTVGEVSRPRSAGRREIGHGLLAERALEPMLPSIEDFPYAIRTVSELMSSNGSTSMAATCSSCLALMDAGVPLKKMVSGIAMGLMIDKDNPDNYVVLSDIQGEEDFAGDMDFKVTGTDEGITALQMDIKVLGLTTDIMAKALTQAKGGRLHILEHMQSVINTPNELSPYAPRVESISVHPDKIREIIGKGGETIQGITAETGTEIDIKDDGTVMISSPDKAKIEAAKQIIKGIAEDPEVGTIYKDKPVVSVMDFGAFVQILPGKDGLVHVSELSEERVAKVSDVVKEGDKVTVKLVAIDDRGRLQLSMKAAARELKDKQ